MRLYIAGRIRNAPDYQSTFAQAAQKLRLEGHTIFNPAAANLEGLPLAKIMSYVLSRLCEDAEGVAMLPGWWRSGGARIEWMLAKYLKMKIIYL